MKTVKTIEEIRRITSEWRKEGKRIGFVPTMGALHEGHLSLVDEALKRSDEVVVSIFVNPTQFGPDEDLDKYPRTLEKDIEKCKQRGVSTVFSPSVDQMYPEKNLTWVEVEKVTDGLCGKSRPEHFRGVCTVCTKLFNIVQPDIAVFGQKDAQQAVVIRRMVKDLNILLSIVVCPIVRENDGLAISSRNQYLNAKERMEATLIYKSLKRAEYLIAADDVKKSKKLKKAIIEILEEGETLKPEYIEMVDLQTLKPMDRIDGKAMIAVAVRAGDTRLIDNIIVDGSK